MLPVEFSTTQLIAGAKLCYIANLLGEETEGSVTGVDVSEQRLSACKTVCTKYKIPNVRLFLEDGTTFGNLAPSKEKSKEEEGKEASNENSIPLNQRGKRKKKKKKKVKIQGLFYESEGIKSFGNLNSQLYDKVLVDAECTHDGSVKHIAKYDKLWGWDTFEKRFMDPEVFCIHDGFLMHKRINTITNLQKKLLTNGFKLLKPGGTIVYSTCSFSRKQNEDVITWFLEQEPLAEVVALDEPDWPIQKSKEKDER